jgi:hypothetical protein
MLLGVISALPFGKDTVLQKLPVSLQRLVASFVLLCGLWNLLWYASQHLGEKWGNAALGSGILLIITALYLFNWQKLPQWLLSIKPLVVLLLFGFAMLYSITIYNL